MSQNLKEAFDELMRRVCPKPKCRQRKTCERMFMAGALAGIHKILQTGALPEPEGEQAIGKVHREVLDYFGIEEEDLADLPEDVVKAPDDPSCN
jgi:molybdopterin-biosynthesis enzyme MoeA-like protein